MKNTKRILSFIFILSILASMAMLSTSAMIAPLQKGEVDHTPGITVRDATLIQKYIAGLEELKKQQIYCADTDFDDSVTVKDATIIQKYVADLIEKFPYPEDFKGAWDYLRAVYFYADYNSGVAMAGTPVTFTACADGALTYEYKIDGEVVRERNEQNTFTTTFDEAGIYNVEVVMYNWCDSAITKSMEYEVVAPYTSDTLLLRALYYDHNTDWQYTGEFTATAQAFMGSGEYEYEFYFDGKLSQEFSSDNTFTRTCNPMKEEGDHLLTVKIRDKSAPEQVIEADLDVRISADIG